MIDLKTVQLKLDSSKYAKIAEMIHTIIIEQNMKITENPTTSCVNVFTNSFEESKLMKEFLLEIVTKYIDSIPFTTCHKCNKPMTNPDNIEKRKLGINMLDGQTIYLHIHKTCNGVCTSDVGSHPWKYDDVNSKAVCPLCNMVSSHAYFNRPNQKVTA